MNKQPSFLRVTMYASAFAISVLLVWIGLCMYIFGTMIEKNQQYESQNECIAEYIEKGVERKAIKRDGEFCKVEE